MMFILRAEGERRPPAGTVAVKRVRRTPPAVADAAGRTDFFCVGETEAMAALRAEGWNVVELRDGWYADDAGGGVGIWGQGKYWEIRDTPFTVVEAAAPAATTEAPGAPADEMVNVRRAIFGA
ncbi:MAG: hypothetical protein JO267_01905 [Alphaproteobacteria bacterium]|nr:hypothetical protein [Alphaproteobacteria bacterium]MBV9860881.1 hypothetical protein [Alphaproteobacteria bacterium]